MSHPFYASNVAGQIGYAELGGGRNTNDQVDKFECSLFQDIFWEFIESFANVF